MGEPYESILLEKGRIDRIALRAGIVRLHRVRLEQQIKAALVFKQYKSGRDESTAEKIET